MKNNNNNQNKIDIKLKVNNILAKIHGYILTIIVLIYIYYSILIYMKLNDKNSEINLGDFFEINNVITSKDQIISINGVAMMERTFITGLYKVLFIVTVIINIKQIPRILGRKPILDVLQAIIMVYECRTSYVYNQILNNMEKIQEEIFNGAFIHIKKRLNPSEKFEYFKLLMEKQCKEQNQVFDNDFVTLKMYNNVCTLTNMDEIQNYVNITFKSIFEPQIQHEIVTPDTNRLLIVGLLGAVAILIIGIVIFTGSTNATNGSKSLVEEELIKKIEQQHDNTPDFNIVKSWVLSANDYIANLFKNG